MNRELSLKELRKKTRMTQEAAAKYLGISRKTLHQYEVNPEKGRRQMYEYLYSKLQQLIYIDENHGILTQEEIKKNVNDVLEKYDIKTCYLFGSYARGDATESSDIDLLIDTPITGLDFYGLVEELRRVLCKRVDLLNLAQLNNNLDLLSEILKDGIKLYG